MSLQEKEVQGQALYLEFRKNYQTIQVIITPDGFCEEGNVVKGAFFRRMLTKDQPKRRWKTYSLRAGSALLDCLGDEIVPSESAVAELTAQRAISLYDFMESLVRGGYKLVNDKPIYVEVSKEDFTAIRKLDTPTKVINRIKAVRTALNFPEEVVNIPTTSI